MVESYVVQIYRRDPDDRRRFNGTVERVGNGREKAFGNMQELWEFLATENDAPKACRCDRFPRAPRATRQVKIKRQTP
jgi:hypothetical protein